MKFTEFTLPELLQVIVNLKEEYKTMLITRNLKLHLIIQVDQRTNLVVLRDPLPKVLELKLQELLNDKF